MLDTGGNGEVIWVTVVKVLKKRLTTKPQSDRATARLDSRLSSLRFAQTVATSDEGIGELDCPKSP
ncbi:MAG: hypothetical protein F6K56_06100 [Moorea sp. SIO3G5]|nr:hypothetical protein [Moorena sp. SIO3G5]